MNFLLVEKIFFYAAFALYAGAMALFFLFFALKSEKAGKYANALMTAAFVFHTLALAARGIEAGHLPLTNQYEFASSFAWGVCLCSPWSELAVHAFAQVIEADIEIALSLILMGL